MRKSALDSIHALARTDKRVLFIGSDPGAGTLDGMKEELPGQFLIEGIAEQHVVGMAAGLAMDGFVPYVNTIATFLSRRCLEQVELDVCMHDLPVRLIANGGGLVYAPLGPTHTAIDDIALMRHLPGMSVICPADKVEMRGLIAATLDWQGPIYFRLGKGGDPIITGDDEAVTPGKAIIKRQGKDVVIVTTGIMTHKVLEAAGILAAQGIEATVVHMATIKPLDTDTLIPLAADFPLMVTVEEHVINGGLGSAVLESLNDFGVLKPVMRLALPDRFIHNYGSQNELLRRHGLDATSIAATIGNGLSAKTKGWDF